VKNGYITVRVTRDVHARIGELVKKITAGGWRAIGSDRTDSITIAHVVSEALATLEAKAKRR
jgi:hypothetical protein